MSADRICITIVVRPNYRSVAVSVDNQVRYFGECKSLREMRERLGEVDAIVAEEVHRALVAEVH